MREVNVAKDKLIERVTANRNEHRTVFEKAIGGYSVAAVTFFEDQIDKAREGKQFSAFFQEPIPEDHSDDYDAALDMLEMSDDDIITLTAQEFRQYVRDDWGWKRAWTETTSNYILPDGR